MGELRWGCKEVGIRESWTVQSLRIARGGAADWMVVRRTKIIMKG